MAGGIWVAGVARAGSISESPTAPTTNLLTSQLIDLGPGAQDSNGDYTDNSGPVSETFHLNSASNITAITVKGNGDASNNPSLFYHFEVGTFDLGTGQITQIRADTAPESASNDSTNYVTFTFSTPVSAPAGSNLQFSIWSETADIGGNWFGIAHSAPGTHPGDGGKSFNYDVSTTNHDDNSDGLGKNGGWASPGFVAPNVNGYEYVFAVQGAAVPEPASLALLGFGSLLVLSRRRR